MKKINLIAVFAFVFALGSAFASKPAPTKFLNAFASNACTTAITKPDKCTTSDTDLCTIGGVGYYQTSGCSNRYTQP